MSFSYTEKKRVRRSFEKISSVMELPNLLATQVQSYDAFLQRYVDSDKRLNAGLEQVLNSIFPIESHNGFARMEYSGYSLGEPVFNERECKLKGITYEIPLHINCDLFFIDKDSGKLKEGKSQNVYMGTVPLMTEHGTFIINGTERVVVSQLHRSPGLFFDHDKGKSHSSGKVLYGARVIPYRGSWLDFEFDAKDLVYVRIDRRRKLLATILLKALKLTNQQILEKFYETEIYKIKKNEIFQLQVIPRIFNLVLIEPGKSFVRVIQSIGRGIRKAQDKEFVQIWDITSTAKFAKRHLTARKKFYKEANYPYNIEKIDYENPYTGK